MSRWNFGSLGISPATVKLIAASCPSNDLARTNKIFVNPSDLPSTTELAVINTKFVYVVAAHNAVESSNVGFNAIQRRELRLAIRDHVEITPFEWPKKTPIECKAATFEIDLVSKKASPIELEAEELSPLCVRNFVGHVPTVGQSFVLDFYGTSVLLKCSSLVAGTAVERAILTPTTEFYFGKAPGSSVKIKGGDSRPKDVFRSDFDFEKMGIGGLDKEFSDIFRRAFASRVFPPSVIQKLGIQRERYAALWTSRHR
ncbi:Aspartate decarboxylase-like protein [Gracilaria domingensis]|nr:Aspartate decarboxylase-like protein [Gracilaria domingensis]